MDVDTIIMNLLSTSKAQTHSSKLLGKLTELDMDELIKVLSAVYESKVKDRLIEYKCTADAKEKIRKVSSWLINSKRPGLLLYGDCGTGKTTMMLTLYQLLSIGRKMGSVRYLTANKLSDLFRNESTKHLYDETLNCDVVFIDDLGCEPERCLIYGTEYTPLRDLIYNRYERQLITVISTNLDDKDIEERYGKRVWDRMKEVFDRIVYTEKSYRGE